MINGNNLNKSRYGAAGDVETDKTDWKDRDNILPDVTLVSEERL